jgi:hypothetical protein
MNKIYTAAALLLIGGSVSAQRVSDHARHTFLQVNKLDRALPHADAPANSERAAGEVLFSEDFANGLAGNNGVGPWTTAGANGNIWRQCFTGPVGAYSDPGEGMDDPDASGTNTTTSPTYANGWMIFNSDSANTNWADTSMIDPPVPFTGSLVSPALNLTGYSAISVNFYQRMRFCCSDGTAGHFVEVSTDGGATWPSRFSTEFGILDNDDPGVQLISVNIASALAGQPLDNVMFRFTQDGANGITHYHWQIDDIEITTLPGNDLIILQAGETIWSSSTAMTYDSLHYTNFPIAQLRPRAVNLTAFNNGSNVAHNTSGHFTSVDGYDETVNIGDLDAGATSAIFAPLWTPTATVGDHTVSFTLSSDSTDIAPDDNSASVAVTVSDYTYAVDDDSRDGGYNDNDNGDAFKLGNAFYINQDAMLYGVDVAFSIVSATDVEVNCQLLAASDFSVLAETAYHTLTPDDLSALGGNTMVSFPFDSPVNLSAGTDYVVVVNHFGGANVLIGTSGTSPAQASFFYRQSNDTWYYTTSTPMVRMNFAQNIGIGEANVHNGIGLGQNYPNPANNGSTRIDFSLEHAAPVTMELRDVSGKLVQTLVNGVMSEGVHHVDVNTAKLGVGVYFYTLTTDKATSTKRMTVVR